MPYETKEQNEAVGWSIPMPPLVREGLAHFLMPRQA